MKPSKEKNGRRIGITGGIASGKSTLVALLKEEGYRVLEADGLAHAEMGPGKSLSSAILRAFGPDLDDGQGGIDRKKLGERVFEDPALRKRLDALTHPLLYAKMATLAKRYEEDQPGGLLFFDIPLLFETAALSACLDLDETWLVSAPEEVRIQRIQMRDGLDRAQAQARISAQMSEAEKRAKADRILYNEGSLADLERQMHQALELERV